MGRELKIYGWTGYRPGTTHGQSREIVAAPSMAEVLRITGKRKSQLLSLSESRSEEEFEIAMKKPGVIHWRDFDTHLTGWHT